MRFLSAQHTNTDLLYTFLSLIFTTLALQLPPFRMPSALSTGTATIFITNTIKSPRFGQKTLHLPSALSARHCFFCHTDQSCWTAVSQLFIITLITIELSNRTALYVFVFHDFPVFSQNTNSLLFLHVTDMGVTHCWCFNFDLMVINFRINSCLLIVILLTRLPAKI